ncbi:uncharacterized protein LOC144447981 isoform X3 [Glandiceps talaboti]
MSRGSSADGAQLFIGRLSKQTRQRDLEDIFTYYGRLARCDIKYGRKTGSPGSGMAYAFVDYDDRRDAEDAIKYENGREVCGQSIVVEWARGPRHGFQADDECYKCHRSGHWARNCRDPRYVGYSRQGYRSSSRSRSGGVYNKRSHYRSRSRSRSRDRDYERSRKHRRHRSRSHSKERRRSDSRDRHSRNKHKNSSRNHKKSSSSHKRKSRSHSKSESRSRSRSKSIDRVESSEASASPDNRSSSSDRSTGSRSRSR